ncbi:MAG: hypothetical protein ABII12_14510 [Planctomycetota bacterium]
MTMTKHCGYFIVVGIMAALCSTAAADIDGTEIRTKYAGFLVASQANGTAFGNHQDIQEEGILVGSELDALYVTADATDLWIGITGNLPNKLANSQAIVILLDSRSPQAAPVDPNILVTNTLEGDFGGGVAVAHGLDGTILDRWNDPDWFNPNNLIVVNRSGETTFVDSWDLTTNAKDPWFAELVSLDPYNEALCDYPPFGCYLSAWMDTTNVLGVNYDELTDGPTQEGLAGSAVEGLRLRLDRTYFGVGQEIRLMVLLASPGDDGVGPAAHVGNQILPPLSEVDDPGPQPDDHLGYRPNFDEAYEHEPGVFGYTGTQFAAVDLTLPAHTGTPAEVGGYDGSDIPGAWPAGSLVATQRLHTSYGDAVEGTLNYTVEGSELDELYVRADDEYLHVAVSGNLEGNCNKIALLIDADPVLGENTMDANSPPDGDPGATFILGWEGRTFDDDFAPEHVYFATHCGGTLYVDHFSLLELDADVQEYQGFSVVGSGSGVLDSTGGSNPNNNEFAFNHSNNNGVVASDDLASPGEPSTATTGLEARISLTEIGATFGSCADIKVMAVLTGSDGTYLSNQFLPALIWETDYNVGSYTDPDLFPFDFGETDPVNHGDPAFEGDQFAPVELRRLGDVLVDVDCCINLDDLGRFVQVLLDKPEDAITPAEKFWADMNQDGSANGDDIQLFTVKLIAEGACPP